MQLDTIVEEDGDDSEIAVLNSSPITDTRMRQETNFRANRPQGLCAVQSVSVDSIIFGEY